MTSTAAEGPGWAADPADRAAVGAALARLRRRRRLRGGTVAVALGVAWVAVFVCSLAFGEVTVAPRELPAILAGAGQGGDHFIVNRLRLPRATAALLAGAAFGASGALMQGLVRNPLASPDIVGVTAGASAAAAVAIVGFGAGGVAVSAAAFGGASVVAALIYVLAWRDGVTGYRLVLVGVALAAMLNAVVSYFLTQSEVYEAREALVWLTGSLNATTWPTVWGLACGVAVLLPLAVLARRPLETLRLGDDTARALGVPVEAARAGVLAVSTALAASATAAVGPVAFVAFVAGPIARRLVRGGTAPLAAAGVGALVMAAADLLGQNAIPGTSLPVGVVTAIVGAPYLLWLLATANRSGNRG